MAASLFRSFQAHVLDLRSLAAFRILLGLYSLYDIYSRVNLGKYDLAWYTSVPEELSFLAETDSPHGAPLHKIWFYRGSAALQIFLFAVTTLVTLCFFLGYQCHGPLKVALYMLKVSLQGRSFPVNDGSDTFSIHLYFWSCFLPMAEVWSLDSLLHQKKKGVSPRATTEVQGLPCLALTIQLFLMYWGTVSHRTIDLFPWNRLGRSEWLPPSLVAVHYAVSSSFATRTYWFTRWIRTYALLSKSMTMAATVLEVCAPLGCLLAGKHRHWFALILFQLHFGLFLTFNLPNWQSIGMLIQVVWIPSHVWDRLLKTTTSDSDDYKKTDGDIVMTNHATVSPKHVRSNLVSRGLQVFWFIYMIYNWVGNRGWVRKHDRGDIGEAMRLSQYWVMYATVGKVAHNTILTGILGEDAEEESERLDLLKYIKTRQFVQQEDVDFIPLDMSSRFPSQRWERAVHGWASAGGRRSELRVKKLCQTLCILVNQDRAARNMAALDAIEMRFQHLKILPPGSSGRYVTEKRLPDTVVKIPCELVPRE